MGTGWNSSRRSSQSDALVGMSASISMRYSAAVGAPMLLNMLDVRTFASKVGHLEGWRYDEHRFPPCW